MIEFVTVVLFGCYSAAAIDEVIDLEFNPTEMREQIEFGACFYGWTPDVKVGEIYKEFKWSDGDDMYVLKGKAPNGDSIYFWAPKSKIESLQGQIA